MRRKIKEGFSVKVGAQSETDNYKHAGQSGVVGTINSPDKALSSLLTQFYLTITTRRVQIIEYKKI